MIEIGTVVCLKKFVQIVSRPYLITLVNNSSEIRRILEYPVIFRRIDSEFGIVHDGFDCSGRSVYVVDCGDCFGLYVKLSVEVDREKIAKFREWI